MKFKKPYVILCTVIFLTLACSKQKKNTDKSIYNFYEVSQEDLVEYIETNGSVEPRNDILVYAPTKGRLEKILVGEGDKVKKGQVLAIVSSESRVEILDMAAHENLKEKQYWEKQILPIKIFAPISGKIYEILTLPGDTIKGAIAKMSDKLIVHANIDEIDVSKLRVGSAVKISFDANESKMYIGELVKISEVSKKINNVNVYIVDIVFDENIFNEEKFKARSGMSVTVKIPVAEQKNALALPASSVNNESNRNINVTLKNGEKRKVHLGKIYANKVHVKEGLSLGDSIRVKAFDVDKDKNKQSILKFFQK